MNRIQAVNFLALTALPLGAALFFEYFGLPISHPYAYSVPIAWAILCSLRLAPLSRALAVLSQLPFMVYLDKYCASTGTLGLFLGACIAANASVSLFAASVFFRGGSRAVITNILVAIAYHFAFSSTDPLLVLFACLPANAIVLLATWKKAKSAGGENLC